MICKILQMIQFLWGFSFQMKWYKKQKISRPFYKRWFHCIFIVCHLDLRRFRWGLQWVKIKSLKSVKTLKMIASLLIIVLLPLCFLETSKSRSLLECALFMLLNYYLRLASIFHLNLVTLIIDWRVWLHSKLTLIDL